MNVNSNDYLTSLSMLPFAISRNRSLHFRNIRSLWTIPHGKMSNGQQTLIFSSFSPAASWPTLLFFRQLNARSLRETNNKHTSLFFRHTKNIITVYLQIIVSFRRFGGFKWSSRMLMYICQNSAVHIFISSFSCFLFEKL